MSTVNPSEDRLKKLLRTSMTPTQQSQANMAPQPTHVEVNMNGSISPIANIKVVGVG